MISACVAFVDGRRAFVDACLDTLFARCSSNLDEALVCRLTQTPGDDEVTILRGRPVRTFDVHVPGPFPPLYGHAYGLHACLARCTRPYVLLTDPDVLYTGERVDERYLDAHKRAVFVGAQHHTASAQAFQNFPTVINLFTARSALPHADFLAGDLRMRPFLAACGVPPYGPPDPWSDTDYQRCDGLWLAQSPIPSRWRAFPKPDGLFDVGCNLWLHAKEQGQTWSTLPQQNGHYTHRGAPMFWHMGGSTHGGLDTFLAAYAQYRRA